jgi:hypothetical protein
VTRLVFFFLNPARRQTQTPAIKKKRELRAQTPAYLPTFLVIFGDFW